MRDCVLSSPGSPKPCRARGFGRWSESTCQAASHARPETTLLFHGLGGCSEARATSGALIWKCTRYAVGRGTLALINAGLAQSKNRSGLAWFLLSIVLGPIATLLIVVLQPGTGSV